MHPYVIEQLVQERRDVLSRMADAEHRARAARWAAMGARPPRRPGQRRVLATFGLAMVAGLARRWPIRPTPATRVTAVDPRPQTAGRPC